MIELVRDAYPDASQGRATNYSGQLFAFAHRIQEGDLIAMPLRGRPQIAIGRATGPYTYRTDLGGFHHTRPVEWLRPDVRRTAFEQDLLYSLGAFMTVCQIRRNDAEERVKAILAGKKDPGAGERAGNGGDVPGDQPTDIEQLARDQILSHI